MGETLRREVENHLAEDLINFRRKQRSTVENRIGILLAGWPGR